MNNPAPQEGKNLKKSIFWCKLKKIVKIVKKPLFLSYCRLFNALPIAVYCRLAIAVGKRQCHPIPATALPPAI